MSQTLDRYLESLGRETADPPESRFVSYHIKDLWPRWQEEAKCAGTGNSYYFGTDDDKPTMSLRAVRNASKLCDACPVYLDCLRHSLTVREEYGVWAGTSGRTRKKYFTRLDNGETVDQLIEEITHERRGVEPPSPIVIGGGAGVPHAAPGIVAL